MRAEWYYYSTFIDDDEKKIGNVPNLIQDGVRWADNVEIFLFAMIYQRQVHIVISDGSETIVNGDIDTSLTYGNNPIYIYFNGVNHYEILILVND